MTGAVTMTLLLLAGNLITCPANAASTSPATPSGSQASTAAQIALVDLESKSVSVTDGVSVFDFKAAIRSGVPAPEALKFAEGMIAGGGSAVGAPTTLAAQSVALKQVVQAAQSQCHGRNRHSTYWWGNQIALDSCKTSVLINAVWAGAGISALGGIIASATGAGVALGAIAAAVLTVGAGALGICASWGNGTYLNQFWTGTPGCWGQ